MGRESREVWQKRVEQWCASGLSVKEFARQMGVNAHTLAGWRWRLHRRVRTSTTAPLAIRSSPLPANKPVDKRLSPEAREIDFVELMSAPAAEPRFEVAAASGWTVRVPAQFDAEALRRLLAVLEQA